MQGWNDVLRNTRAFERTDYRRASEYVEQGESDKLEPHSGG